MKKINAFNKIENIEIDNLNISLEEEENIKTDKNKESNLQIRPYLLVMKSLLPDIKEEDLEYENIYPDRDDNLNLIFPELIIKIFFYYFTINKDLQSKYQFILTEERKKFLQLLENFIYSPFGQKIKIIGGPKGIGKTTTLIFFSFIKEYRIFYINLEAFKKNNDNLKKKDLRIQLAKLYGEFKDNDGGKSKKELEEFIAKNYLEMDTLELLFNIINKFKDFVMVMNICFVL